jgi:NADH-quinone oxidoreductase subunit C/D
LFMADENAILPELNTKFADALFSVQSTRDEILTLWVAENRVRDVLRFLKSDAPRPYRMLFDLTALDERIREHEKDPPRDFTLVYQLLSFDRNDFIRLKVALNGDYPSVRSIADIWPSANWYEREVWDLFGIKFDGHPNLRRILLPPGWDGHPLRKEHPARATEMGQFRLPEDKAVAEEQKLKFRPEEWGMKRHSDGSEFMYLNMGPQHPGTHGPFRVILELDGEEIVDAVPDIGYHHRGAEKMAERQSWHTFIPYTDRIDYLGGVMNNLPYVMAVEKLAGIEVPDKAKVMRVMLAEFFRISSHLVFYGTFVQDLGAMSPVFYMFTDRERVFGVIEAICGGRMHPSWFRIGGVADDLPNGWNQLVREFVEYFPKRLDEYEKLVMQNAMFKARTRGVGTYTQEEAIEWGVTGAGLRACGLAWDFRKMMPYSGYDQFEFDIPTGQNGDCYDRCMVRVEELRQSLRIIEQCLHGMPEGPYKSDNRLATPPVKGRTMHDIETLITHFLNVSWGPVIPPGEAFSVIEATKGANGYYLTSDGNVSSYRTRIRTPSFAHLQMIPFISRGTTIPDLIALLGSIDYVMADVDR